MKCVILAAGYGTRVSELIGTKPKALLEYNGKVVLSSLVGQVEKLDDIDEIFVISNNLFYSQFVEWAKAYPNKKRITIVNDHTNNPDERLGAVGDFEFVIDKKGINDDVLLLSSDTAYDDETLFEKMVDLFHQTHGNIIMGVYHENRDELTRYGVISVDENLKVTDMVEKPEHPQSNIASMSFYIFTKESVAGVKEYMNKFRGDRKLTDAPGNYPAYLLKTGSPLYCFMMSTECYDFGTIESLKEHSKQFNLK